MNVTKSVVFSVVATSAMAAVGLAGGLPAQAAATAQFTEQTVNQNNFVVMAAPRANNAYNLVIVEQVSNQRPCWQLRNDSVGSLNPLLLNFDFTGICGRSTDSNGYSVRMGGQDLGLQYSLRLVPQGNQLALIGTSTVRGLPSVEIGRTRGLSPDYLQIQLNPGWQLSRRVFEGKPLGHVYFSSTTTLANYIASQPKPPVRPVTPPTTQPVKPPVTLPVTKPGTQPVTPPVTTPTQNPYFNDLNQIYRDVLGRNIDAAGLETYSQRLAKGRTLNWVRQDLQNSNEGRQVAINRLYREVLKRDADASGLKVYLNRMQRGWSLDRVRQDLAQSEEAQRLVRR